MTTKYWAWGADFTGATVWVIGGILFVLASMYVPA
jgi:hypothetical protein